MYLHIGADVILNMDNIVTIIDLENSKKSQINSKFLRKIQNNKSVNYVSDPGKEKTLIVTTKGYYLSPISSTTLLKRSILNLGEE